MLWDVSRPSIEVVGESARFPVRRVYCVGRNYVDHIREMKEGDERDLPFFFQKPTDAIVETGDSVPYPSDTADLQYEGELVVAIGKSAQEVSVSNALACVYGYAVGFDMTRRDQQRDMLRQGRPWERGKAFDGSAPCGQITPVGDVPEILNGDLDVAVNGERTQHTSLGLMIWKVPEIIHNLSLQYRLEPGDLIYTGTPAGVGAVERGDRLVARASGLVSLEVSIA